MDCALPVRHCRGEQIVDCVDLAQAGLFVVESVAACRMARVLLVLTAKCVQYAVACHIFSTGSTKA